MKKVKCVVKLFTEESFFGMAWLEDDQRMQDLLNDERKFLPFEKSHQSRGRNSEDVITTIVINKDAIAHIEER